MLAAAVLAIGWPLVCAAFVLAMVRYSRGRWPLFLPILSRGARKATGLVSQTLSKDAA